MKPTVCKKSMFAQNNVYSIDVLCFVLELLVISLKKGIPFIHFLSDLQEKQCQCLFLSQHLRERNAEGSHL